MCVFIGTTNKTNYLKDETGGRRFWPVKTGTIYIEALKQDRDQLFAEAVKLVSDGYAWWPDAEFERLYIKPEQNERYDADVWEDRVKEFTDQKDSGFATGMVLSWLGVPSERQTKGDQNRIAAILENLGWKRGPRAHGGKRLWVRR